MKNSKPFIAEDQVVTLENRIKSILGEDAQIYVFGQSLSNIDDKVQGLSISDNNYHKISIEQGREMTKDLTCIWVNEDKSSPSETLFALATKNNMQKWYDKIYECSAHVELFNKFYNQDSRRFTISEEEQDEFLETWYKNHTKFTI